MATVSGRGHTKINADIREYSAYKLTPVCGQLCGRAYKPNRGIAHNAHERLQHCGRDKAYCYGLYRYLLTMLT